MARTRGIQSFFKPIPKDAPAAPASGARKDPSPGSPSSSALPAPTSGSGLPSTLPARQPAKTAIIKSSDDEDDDLSSDDGLPNLFAQPKTADYKPSPCATPKAKRTAVAFYSSPASARHKFDMQALLGHARSHDAAEANAQRVAEILRRCSAEDSPTTKPGNLYDTMMGVLSDVEDEDGEGERDKLLRAVRRTEVSVDRKRWLFFEASSTAEKTSRSFPVGAALGAWKFLAPPPSRRHFFADGFVYSVQLKRHDLPDAVYLWVLDKLALETSEPLRREYARLLAICPDQTRRLLDEDRIHGLFRAAGASQPALDPAATISGSVRSDEPYSGRRWAVLLSVLHLVARTAHHMAAKPATYAASLLLRLGVDSLVLDDVDVRRGYSDAVHHLLAAVPEGSWGNFCTKACLELHGAVKEASLWWHLLTALPARSSRAVELRRRLALVRFFDDAGCGCEHPDDAVDISRIIDRLGADEFAVDRDTDYYELAALGCILNLAIGDGGTVSADKKFDDGVDRLGRVAKQVWSSIGTGGAAYVSRLEARTTWGILQHQLPHVVRSRPPPRTGVLDIQEEDPFQPRQRQFMARFLGGQKTKAMGDDA